VGKKNIWGMYFRGAGNILFFVGTKKSSFLPRGWCGGRRNACPNHIFRGEVMKDFDRKYFAYINNDKD
jgi:hypothetical protein